MTGIGIEWSTWRTEDDPANPCDFHEWRLFSQRATGRVERTRTAHPGPPDVDEVVAIQVVRWYCVRCRLVEEERIDDGLPPNGGKP